MDKSKFLERMGRAILEAGELAREKQAGVVNIGKKVESIPFDTDRSISNRKAKTVVDEQVQEILLKAAALVVDLETVKIDAEEKTPSISLFKGDGSQMTLVIDPIDGTTHYIDGTENYSICVGLLEKGKILTAIVYFPGKNLFYYIGADGKAYLKKGEIPSEEVIVRSKDSNIIFRNNRMSDVIGPWLKKEGFKVTEVEVDWADGLLRCLQGKYNAVILGSPQIRDVLLGAIIAASSNGYAIDWEGKTLVWPSGGRIPKVMFGAGKIPEDIVSCLKDLS